ncbi:hypothetical protein PtA15_9A304 [Puccinia triticina]|uniref:Anaphase-promoting complex subunit 4 WD40 domain-containing protein n=1 Tax=Puccinia triticina TaxID=208348 RepID=A0ABY7CU82_9BASI|nr:uncharacterized protein PtA15_9A304 [Puccinia triticina]WAQ88179.1 hypothetical protein PtA15_9A304 [Puccinia triticina]WAR60367.1 hypothetical protein PtB15_9B306 [Puccinia triticina]
MGTGAGAPRLRKEDPNARICLVQVFLLTAPQSSPPNGSPNQLLLWEIFAPFNSPPLFCFNHYTAAFKALNWSPHQNSFLASGGGSTGKKICFWNIISGNLDLCAKCVLKYVNFFWQSVFPPGVGQGYQPFADPEASSPRRGTQWITPKQMPKDVYADDGPASVVILAGSLLGTAEKLLATETISWDARQIDWVIAGSMTIMAILTIIVSA